MIHDALYYNHVEINAEIATRIQQILDNNYIKLLNKNGIICAEIIPYLIFGKDFPALPKQWQ